MGRSFLGTAWLGKGRSGFEDALGLNVYRVSLKLVLMTSEFKMTNPNRWRPGLR